MPMAIDSSATGLKQSQHHLNTSLSAYWLADICICTKDNNNAGSNQEIKEIKMKITSIVQSEIAGEVMGIMKR